MIQKPRTSTSDDSDPDVEIRLVSKIGQHSAQNHSSSNVCVPSARKPRGDSDSRTVVATSKNSEVDHPSQQQQRKTERKQKKEDNEEKKLHSLHLSQSQLKTKESRKGTELTSQEKPVEQNPRSKKFNEKKMSSQHKQNCDFVVADYLKRNGYEEILEDFQKLRRGVISSTHQSRHFVTLEKLCESSSSSKKNCSDEKPLDAWTSLNLGFIDLIPHLNPNDSKSEIDKVLTFILDQNFPVRHVNVKYSSASIWIIHKNNKENTSVKNCPGIKFGRFSTGSTGEDGKIEQQWKKLISEAKIKDPKRCISDFKNLGDSETYLSRLRRNLLGAYLGQNLPFIRISADVFNRAVGLLYLNTTRKYTKEEDALILKTVERLGANINTFKELALTLKRSHTSVSRHYDLMTKFKDMHFRSWTTSDYETFFDYVFNKANNGKNSGPDYILSVSVEVITAAAKLLIRVPGYVWLHWLKSIKPVLLAYHDGALHFDWRKQYLKYLAEKKVMTIHDIDWEESKSLFPNHSPISLGKALMSVQQQRNYVSQPLYVTIENYLPKLKAIQRGFEYREKMVQLYDKARGVMR